MARFATAFGRLVFGVAAAATSALMEPCGFQREGAAFAAFVVGSGQACAPAVGEA